MSLIGLRAFAKMLDLEINLSDSPDESEIAALNLTIKEKLNLGFTVSKTIDGFTPLMLYVTFHIRDERLSEELKKKESLNAYTSLRGNNMSTTQRVNALSCAVSTKNLLAIEDLLATNVFSEEADYQVAIELAALTNFPAAISLFAKQGFNLFTYDCFEPMTPLMVASAFGFVDVVREILLTNPKEEFLNIANFYGDTAAILAVKSGNEETIALFRGITSFQQYLLGKSFRERNLENMQLILDEALNWNKNLLIHKSNGIYESLLAEISKIPEDSFREASIKEFEKHLYQQPISEIVNTLILTYSLLINSCPEAANKYLYQLSEALNHNKISSLNYLIMPMDGFGYALTAELWAILKQLIQLNSIRLIDFSGFCPDIEDNDSKRGVCTINLSNEMAVLLVNALIDNTSVTQCHLQLPTKCLPLMKITELVCERNERIAQSKSSLVKDKIYNLYVDAINDLVMQFKLGCSLEDISKLGYSSKKCTVYSLAELTAFFIYEKSASIMEKKPIPPICQELIDDCQNITTKSLQ